MVTDAASTPTKDLAIFLHLRLFTQDGRHQASVRQATNLNSDKGLDGRIAGNQNSRDESYCGRNCEMYLSKRNASIIERLAGNSR